MYQSRKCPKNVPNTPSRKCQLLWTSHICNEVLAHCHTVCLSVKFHVPKFHVLNAKNVPIPPRRKCNLIWTSHICNKVLACVSQNLCKVQKVQTLKCKVKSPSHTLVPSTQASASWNQVPGSLKLRHKWTSGVYIEIFPYTNTSTVYSLGKPNPKCQKVFFPSSTCRADQVNEE